MIRMAALLTVTVVTRARRKKAIIAIRVPMPADPLNPERSSYVTSESPIRTCLNRKPTPFLRKSPRRPAWKIVIDPRQHNCTGIICIGRSRNLVRAPRLRRRTAQSLAEPQTLSKDSFLLRPVIPWRESITSACASRQSHFFSSCQVLGIKGPYGLKP